MKNQLEISAVVALRAEALKNKPSLCFHPDSKCFGYRGGCALHPVSIVQAPEVVVLSFGRGVVRAEVKVFPSVGLFWCLFFPLFPVVGSHPGPPVS